MVRADYANFEDASAGILYSIRRMEVFFTLSTATGSDDVTGLGTPNGSFVTAVASK